MLNLAQIIGRLGRDPEVKYTASGAAICNLSIATDESYTDKDGQKVDRTEWHKVTCYQRQAENCGKFLTKGSLVYVEGKIQTRKWQDQQGQDRYSTEIVASRVQFLDKKGSEARQEDTPKGQSQTQDVGKGYLTGMPTPGGNQAPFAADGMDDVPF